MADATERDDGKARLVYFVGQVLNRLPRAQVEECLQAVDEAFRWSGHEQLSDSYSEKVVERLLERSAYLNQLRDAEDRKLQETRQRDHEIMSRRVRELEGLLFDLQSLYATIGRMLPKGEGS